ncbi:MAG: Mur ligase family protein [Nitrospirae bacterium]|nr:Mur ligase family protein [Nitrospirota bacterium]
MITGTKGKTTTTRMLAYILTQAGHRVGFTSTDGAVINGHYVHQNDCAGYAGARTILTNRSVTAAVLETARGGLMRDGLYVDRCQVAALLNVGREQIGMDGIDTVEQMAALKQQVINAARDTVVLNADDAQCRALIGQYPASRVVLFSLSENNSVIHDHIQKGGTAYVVNDSWQGAFIERKTNRSCIPVVSIANLPSSCNGLFPQNIANAMAAAALAEGMGIPMETVKTALKSFENSLEHSPGRFNFLEGYSQTVLLDQGYNVPACMALMESLSKIKVLGRRVCMLSTPGNRPGWHYTELGALLAPHFDHFVCYEVEQYRRGRAVGEILGLLVASLMKAGVNGKHIVAAQGYTDATRQLSRVVGRDDLVVLLGLNVHECLSAFRTEFAAHQR